MQFWNTSTKEAPLWAWARLKTSGRYLGWVSIPRATNLAPQPSAYRVAERGLSNDPIGVDGDRVPIFEVGEY